MVIFVNLELPVVVDKDMIVSFLKKEKMFGDTKKSSNDFVHQKTLVFYVDLEQ